ncbi:unnamed protein product [Oncorhynchus mykiss]|uniref:Uncharacterized protein n=1 Tax=Oncorhynchus mykiss TaxID=8022 RepID=A0A060ZH04_ONCMY|nr:unnamed protein product [Oncorhynchus mykiss]
MMFLVLSLIQNGCFCFDVLFSFSQSKAFLQTAASIAPHMYEPHFNYSTLSDKIGDLQSSYTAAQRSEDAFPEHVDTQQILKHLRQHFAVL